MAAKKAAPKKTTARKSGGGGSFDLMGWVKIAAIAVGGVVAGYLWRSFFPVVLPFETKLVADGRSADIPDDARVRDAEDRAARAERELRAAQARVKLLEETKRRSEQELGDLAIKDVLNQ